MWNNRPIIEKAGTKDPCFFYSIIISCIVLTDWTSYFYFLFVIESLQEKTGKKIDPTIYDRVYPFPI